MENFSSDSLRQFLSGERKKTVEDILENLPDRRTEMQPPGQPPKKGSIAEHDAAVRFFLGEIVNALLSAGEDEKLETILRDHKTFIDDILMLIEQKRQTSK